MRTNSRKNEIWSSSHLSLILSGTSSNEIYFLIGFGNCLLLYRQKALAEFEERLNPCSSQFGGGFFGLSMIQLCSALGNSSSFWVKS